MYSLYQKKIFIVLLMSVFIPFKSLSKLSSQARDKGFVYLHEVDPSILVSLRYCGSENFLGEPVTGYTRPVVVMTKQAARALKKVQKAVEKEGYSLVVYDAYRPQQAVDHFVRWGLDVANESKKNYYYPRINKSEVFEKGYVATRSGHSRGSTVDVTLISLGKTPHEVKEQSRTLLDGFTITILDDGTVDMGSSFDLFDEASHTENDLIDPEFKKMRRYLKSVMEKYGFKNLTEEWWHFTLKNEPFPATDENSYFNFIIE